MAWISRYLCKKLKSKILDFPSFVSVSSQLCITNHLLMSMLKILSDIIIIHIVGASTKISKSLQLCFRVLLYFLNVQNLQFLADPPSKLLPNQYKCPKSTIFGWPFHANCYQNNMLTFHAKIDSICDEFFSQKCEFLHCILFCTGFEYTDAEQMENSLVVVTAVAWLQEKF